MNMEFVSADPKWIDLSFGVKFDSKFEGCIAIISKIYVILV
jgi:hypothetical protein